MSETGEKKVPSFEERLQQVQEITGRIESGSLPLEDAVKEYESGIRMLGELDRELNDMNRRITVLQGDGKTEELHEDI